VHEHSAYFSAAYVLSPWNDFVVVEVIGLEPSIVKISRGEKSTDKSHRRFHLSGLAARDRSSIAMQTLGKNESDLDIDPAIAILPSLMKVCEIRFDNGSSRLWLAQLNLPKMLYAIEEQLFFGSGISKLQLSKNFTAICAMRVLLRYHSTR
jgi:hypothetical protein